MKNLITVLLLVLTVSPLLGQDYQAGVASKSYQLIGNDTIFPTKSIYENIKNTSQFTVLTKINELTNAQEEIDKLGMVTVFLPTDTAFSAYDEKALKKMMTASNADALKEALMRHVIIGRVDQNSLQRNLQQNGGSAYFRSPADIDPEFKSGGSQIQLRIPHAAAATITATNYYHKLGFIHVVDAFLIEQ